MTFPFCVFLEMTEMTATTLMQCRVIFDKYERILAGFSPS